MARYLCRREPVIIYAASSYLCTRVTYLRSPTAALQFLQADLAFPALLLDDFHQSLA